MRGAGGSATLAGCCGSCRVGARCTGCGATHVMLQVVLLVRRADTAAVIGAGVTAKATGAGHRLIAALLGRPAETVPGWLRRFADRVEPVQAVFTRWCRDLAPDPVLPGPAGSAWGRRACRGPGRGCGARGRFGIGEVPLWRAATAISAARLLSPGWPSPDGRS